MFNIKWEQSTYQQPANKTNQYHIWKYKSFHDTYLFNTLNLLIAMWTFHPKITPFLVENLFVQYSSNCLNLSTLILFFARLLWSSIATSKQPRKKNKSVPKYSFVYFIFFLSLYQSLLNLDSSF